MPWHSAHIFTSCPLSCHESLSDSVFNSKCILSTVFSWSARLPALSEKEMRSVLSLLNPHCAPGLLLFFWVVTNHSLNDVPIILSRINSKCTGAVYYWDSLFSFLSFIFILFYLWEFYFHHLQSFGTNSVSPPVFTRRKIQEQLTFESRLHLPCFSDGSSYFCQGCGKPLAAVRCVCYYKFRLVKIHVIRRPWKCILKYYKCILKSSVAFSSLMKAKPTT